MNLDVETRSEVDLKKVGAHTYFEHPSTDIWCACYAFEDEEPRIWRRGENCPQDIQFFLERTDEPITAWNAAFERLAWRHLLKPAYGFPDVPDTRWRCTMTEALGMNLPAKLDSAGPAVNSHLTKDDGGHRLMLKMCRPRSYDALGRAVWWDDARDIDRLIAYCQQDVRVERAISKVVLRLRPMEKLLYDLDMAMNDRGVYIDDNLCRAAEYIVHTSMQRLDDEMRRVTNQAVAGCSNVSSLISWLQAQGLSTESVDKEHTEDLLAFSEDLLAPNVKRALELRQEGSKTSTSKIKTMLRRRQSDGRIRGNLQFYGASATGRWAARGVQLQNLSRPVILGNKASKPTPLDQQIETAIKYIKGGSSMMIELAYGKPLTLVADCVRSMICAPPGHILRSSDFSNIEGRVVAWLAGQNDKLEAFRAFDAGLGPDLYLVAAAGIYNVSVNQAEPYRQIGKVAELSLGFQGGPRAFAKMAKNYGVRIAELYEGIWKNADETLKDEALLAWDDRGCRDGMSKHGWLASEVIKLAWRAKNYRIVALWTEIETAAILAVKHEGDVTLAQGDPNNFRTQIKFRKNGSFLFCLLPSGRGLCYPYPTIRIVKTPWGGAKEQLFYKAVDQFTKKWGSKAYYGGLGVENITQAVARDIMAEAMLRVEEAGYNPVLTIHDEIISETPVNFGSLEKFNEIMVESPDWATGLPITAGGWEGARYRKN